MHPPVAKTSFSGALGYVAFMSFAVFLGLAVAILGNMLGIHVLYYLIALAAIVGGSIVVFLHPNPERLLFLLTVIGLPLVATMLPPRRFGISLFDAMMLVSLVIVLTRHWANPHIAQSSPFFVSWHFLLAYSGLFILIALSHFKLHSLWVWVETLAIFVFFRSAVSYLNEKDGFERLVRWLSVAVIILFIGVLIDRFAHINLTLGGGNPNQYLLLKGELIRRAGGFFQDPQKSAQFFGCVAAFLFPLLIRQRFPGQLSKLAGIAFLISLAGILLSGSRMALIAVLVVIPLSMTFLSRSSGVIRFLILFGTMTAALTVASMVPLDSWAALLPSQITARFETLGESLEFRMHIWFDTWKMFADQPLWGIGPGSFRDYLRTTNPTSLGFYGLGALTGEEYIPDQPENGYLKILYEGGIIGSFCALILVWAALRKGISQALSSSSGEAAQTEALAALAGLAVFGITFLTLFTPSDEKNVVVLCLLFAVLWQGNKQTKSGERATIHQISPR